MKNDELQKIVEKIKALVAHGRADAARAVNNAVIGAYWEIGRTIVEVEQDGNIRSQYGDRLLTELSKELTRSAGKGFSRSNLSNMRLFYSTYPIVQSVTGQLSWTHYCELLTIKDSDARAFYEKEAMISGWSVREMKRQIDTSLFERLLLADGKANKEKVLALAQSGNELHSPENILKEPVVLEFLDIPADKVIPEKRLEDKLLRHLENLLLELGKGFMFVGSQYRMLIGTKYYHVDLVFYNKILKAYVLIDLKKGKLTLEDAGQMNGYLNYFKTEVNDEGDNPPVGIILCRDRNDIVAEYALGGLSNQVFASSYVYYIPNKERLANEVRILIDNEAASHPS